MTLEQASELADEARAAGWEVLAVLGQRPGGPPRTRFRNPYHPKGDEWRGVRSVSPTIKVRNPRTGRAHNVSSRARWERLRAWGLPTEER